MVVPSFAISNQLNQQRSLKKLINKFNKILQFPNDGKYNKIALLTGSQKIQKTDQSKGQYQWQHRRVHDLGSSSWAWYSSCRGLGGRCQNITFCLRSVFRTRPHKRAPVLAGLLEPPSSALSGEQLPKSSSSARSLASATLILTPTHTPKQSTNTQTPTNTVRGIIPQRVPSPITQNYPACLFVSASVETAAPLSSSAAVWRYA